MSSQLMLRSAFAVQPRDTLGGNEDLTWEGRVQ
jgi:hypothetical protein